MVLSLAARVAIAICCDSLVAYPTSLVVHEPIGSSSPSPTLTPLPPRPYPLGLNLNLNLNLSLDLS